MRNKTGQLLYKSLSNEDLTDHEDKKLTNTASYSGSTTVWTCMQPPTATIECG